jgi:hypothetical protein
MRIAFESPRGVALQERGLSTLGTLDIYTSLGDD